MKEPEHDGQEQVPGVIPENIRARKRAERAEYRRRELEAEVVIHRLEEEAASQPRERTPRFDIRDTAPRDEWKKASMEHGRRTA